MINKLSKTLLALVCTMGVVAASSTGFAYHRGYWGGTGLYIGFGPGYYGNYYGNYYRGCYGCGYGYYGYGYSRCRWIPGHYNYYGYWIRGHRVCWRY